MSRIAYISDEPISIPRLIDTDALLRNVNSFATSLGRSVRNIGKFLAMWYL